MAEGSKVFTFAWMGKFILRIKFICIEITKIQKTSFRKNRLAKKLFWMQVLLNGAISYSLWMIDVIKYMSSYLDWVECIVAAEMIL